MMSSSRPMRAHMAAILLCCYGAKSGSAIMVKRAEQNKAARLPGTSRLIQSVSPEQLRPPRLLREAVRVRNDPGWTPLLILLGEVSLLIACLGHPTFLAPSAPPLTNKGMLAALHRLCVHSRRARFAGGARSLAPLNY